MAASTGSGAASGAAAGATFRIALISDVHGNAVALDAVVKALKREKPDAIFVAGDHVMNGPDPKGAVDTVRELEAAGALVVQGNTDVAVADADYAAAFPWMTEGIPDAHRFAAEWAHDELGDERLNWLRRLPAERRLTLDAGGDTFLALCAHASPGSQTSGLDADLDPSVTLERMARTDARIIAVGHTHLPEIREFGWKLIVNGGSIGFVFDGDPTASWALITVHQAAPGERAEIDAEIRRTEYDTLAVSNALTERALPGDVYRAATIRTGRLVR